MAFQVLVLNNINIGGLINPYIYPLLLIVLPFEIAGWALLFFAFILGLSIDFFSGSFGFHTFAAVFLAGIRPSVVKTLSLGKFDQDSALNIKQQGYLASTIFIGILIFIHHFVYFIVESFSYSGFGYTLLRIILSTIVSIILSVILLLFFYNSRKNER